MYELHNTRSIMKACWMRSESLQLQDFDFVLSSGATIALRYVTNQLVQVKASHVVREHDTYSSRYLLIVVCVR